MCTTPLWRSADRLEHIMTSTRVIPVLGLSLVAFACGGASPRPLPPESQRIVDAAQQAPSSMGEQIYEGRVYALDGRPAPLYRYERRIYRHADTVVSTH